MAEVAAEVHNLQHSALVADETGDVTRQHLSILGAIPCGGKQIHDANIVATMLVHGIPKLLTHNTADFQRFNQLIALVPLVP